MPAARLFRVLCFLLLTSSFAWAGEASDFMKARQQDLRVLIEKPQTPANDEALRAKFDAILDYDTLAESSLGDEWQKISPEQRKEFTSLLKTLVQRAYTKSIRDTLDYEITFKGESSGKGGQLVSTQATHKTDKRKEPIQIDYLLKKSAAGFQVVDIITEGSSLVGNYRNQFKRVIAQKGFAGLLEKMRSKANEGT